MRKPLALALACLAPLAAGCAGALQSALSRDDVAGVDRALAAGADIDREFYAPNLEPVVYACRGDKFESLKHLVDKGARLNGIFFVNTPLNYCIRHARPEAIRYLVEHGAIVRDEDLEDAQKSRPDLVAYLRMARAKKAAGELGLVAPATAAPAAAAAQTRVPTSSDVDAPAARRTAPRPDDFALVIGIEDYQSLPKADYGARDAATVRKHLEAMGLPARNIIALEGQAATGNKIKSYLEEWLPRNLKDDSTLFVYYSGHGAPDTATGEAYLVPWDGDPQFLKSTAYPLRKLYGDLAATRAKRVIVALDACFSGAGGRSVLAKGARPLVSRIADESPAAGKITVFAAASGEQITGSLDEQRHGLFTYFFLKGLSENKSSAKELFDYLKPRVQDEARRQNREQTPALLGGDAPL